MSIQKRSNKKKTNEQFLLELKEIGSLEKFTPLEEYITARIKIKCQCKKCNTIFENTPSHLLKGQGCPECARLITGIPKKLTEEEFDRRLYQINPTIKRVSSYKNLNSNMSFYCEDCKNVFNRNPQVVLKGTPCPICKDKVSFNNKLLRIILSEIKALDFDFEVTFPWSKGKRYDAYFALIENNKKQGYVVEAQGQQHYRDACFRGTKKKILLENTKKNDNLKYNLAIENGLKVIYLNCNTNEHSKVFEEYVKVLGKYFDFTKINLQECFKKAEGSLVVQISKDYNDNDLSVIQLTQKYKIGETTVRTYLNSGTKMGICTYIPYKNLPQNDNKKPVIAYNLNGDKVKEFESILQCSRWFLKEKDLKISPSSIGEVCRGKRKTAGKHIFEYKNKEVL